MPSLELNDPVMRSIIVSGVMILGSNYPMKDLRAVVLRFILEKQCSGISSITRLHRLANLVSLLPGQHFTEKIILDLPEILVQFGESLNSFPTVTETISSLFILTQVLSFGNVCKNINDPHILRVLWN
jgi:hypothetical protein